MNNKCNACGAPLQAGDKFCNSCGTEVQSVSTVNNDANVNNTQNVSTVNSGVNVNNNNQSIPNVETQKTPGKAIASMVCGIVGIFIASIPLGIIALCLGLNVSKEINASPQGKGKGMATAGIVLGIIDIVFGVIAVSMNM